MWTACYAPDENLTTHGFSSEEKAWDFVHSNMCKSCKAAYESYQNGTLTEDDWDWGSCEAEWMVMQTSRYYED